MPFGWRYGKRWHSYFADKEIDRKVVEQKAKQVLAAAVKGQSWKSPRGVLHIPILKDGEVVGTLWEDVPLAELEVGTYWAARFGVKAELVKNQRVVGMLWLES